MQHVVAIALLMRPYRRYDTMGYDMVRVAQKHSSIGAFIRSVVRSFMPSVSQSVSRSLLCAILEHVLCVDLEHVSCAVLVPRGFASARLLAASLAWLAARLASAWMFTERTFISLLN